MFASRRTADLTDVVGFQNYYSDMTVSAHDVASAIRSRLPGVGTKKLHKLLYYCQGHHLAAFGTAIFAETVSAWDMGPVVGSLWYAEKAGSAQHEAASLSEAQLNTVGYVISRYGQLSGLDLEHLTHSEAPWQRADVDREPHESSRIESDWMREYFTNAGSDDDEDRVVLDSGSIRDWLKDAAARRESPATEDSYDAVRARLSRA